MDPLGYIKTHLPSRSLTKIATEKLPGPTKGKARFTNPTCFFCGFMSLCENFGVCISTTQIATHTHTHKKNKSLGVQRPLNERVFPKRPLFW